METGPGRAPGPGGSPAVVEPGPEVPAVSLGLGSGGAAEGVWESPTVRGSATGSAAAPRPRRASRRDFCSSKEWA